ncbi:type I restriction endonuclease subunit R [Luteolibacter marinus]|uniref:type I restriction endonuclease subunit R n=1 Tax=Luteolibacter marinus TaxID=2776705 RepID=UPI0018684FD5|nr:type I restriction endonuclease [Luteolibacter marinus]
MSLHEEVKFEDDICAHLAENGWLHADGDAKAYDVPRALFPADVVEWVKESQPQAWEALLKSHGAAAEAVVLDRLRKQLDVSGTLEVLRGGIDLTGLKAKLAMAQFKPALAMNTELMARYAANRLRVVRQVRYSAHHGNCLDLVLFLNGIPVATAELKTDFTQSVKDAVDQYRFDRHPKPKGQASADALLEFPRGALVHFAVSNGEVWMTTKLEGAETRFLPFNRGHNGGAGNPPNKDGHPTSYLWEDVWARESWLGILGRYLMAELDDTKQLKRVLFPRYHQLDVTRKLVAAVLADGPGKRYLVQNSAGSGKTNSIAWTAHFLADLHDAENKKVFDTVIVVSDRNVLDGQLRDAIFGFQRTLGVVATISGKSGSKSGELAEALAGGKKIVVCTIQTFPHAFEEVKNLAATEGKTFAVIADEAHSSQTGNAAASLKLVLSPEELKEIEDGGEVSTEDILAAQMAAKANPQGITSIAFTATPKPKTMELFGTRPYPDLPAGKNNIPEPFHVYSMRQAIEEGFILDVLKNFTSYKLAYRLAHDGKDWTEKSVIKEEAMKGISRWVRLHPYNIAQKVEVVVEHFREHVAPLLNGKAKSMVVLSSRVEAVRWKLAVEKYIASHGYPIGTLVAFSGEVTDKKSGEDPFTETGETLNPGLKGREIRKAFDDECFHLLLVANKFQTGFDQPLLCGMYVDKRLAGIQAVQTLSRLNRAHPGKDTTYVLDFVNDPQEILKAFKTYHETAELESTTDPDQVLDMRAKLDATGYYDEPEVERVVKAEFDLPQTQSKLTAAIWPVADRLLKRYKAAREALKAAIDKSDADAEKAARDTGEALVKFRHDAGVYLRLHAFLSQIFDYGNTDIEKRAIFFRRLIPLLEFGREREGVDLSKVVLTHHKLKEQGKQGLDLNQGEASKLKPGSETGTGKIRDADKALLSEIIAKVNDLFEGELSDDDKLVYVNHVKSKLMESDLLKQQAANNSKQQFANSPDLPNQLMEAIIGAFESHGTMSKQALNSEKVRHGLMDILLGPARLYEDLRRQDGDEAA